MNNESQPQQPKKLGATRMDAMHKPQETSPHGHLLLLEPSRGIVRSMVRRRTAGTDKAMVTNREFQYEVFQSHSTKDRTVVRPLAERLCNDRLKAPFHFESQNSEFGLAQPGMSANASGSDWAQLEASTFRFRDPLNKERRFIPLRLEIPLVGRELAFNAGTDTRQRLTQRCSRRTTFEDPHNL
jgi:hypothetical protein